MCCDARPDCNSLLPILCVQGELQHPRGVELQPKKDRGLLPLVRRLSSERPACLRGRNSPLLVDDSGTADRANRAHRARTPRRVPLHASEHVRRCIRVTITFELAPASSVPRELIEAMACWTIGGRGAGVPGPFRAAALLHADASTRPSRTDSATVNYNQAARRSTTNVIAIARDND